jgi:hypothetical protein
MTTDWPSETPDFWSEVEQLAKDSPPSDTFKTDWIARKVPLYSWKMMSYDVVYLQDVIHYLNASSGTSNKICAALKEREVGHDKETWDNHVFSPTKHLKNVSVWTIKSFHHWLSLKNMLGHRLLSSYDHIIEIGAGIGESARVLHDTFGFGERKYTIVDLPPILEFSKRNLQDYPVEFTSNIEELHVDRNTLVISTWGLSEIPLDVRERMMDHCKKADLFVAFQAKIFDIDNRDYFCRHYPTKYNKSINLRHIPLHTVDGGNFYMLAS